MFGSRLRELRIEKDIKQSDLGKIIGISPSTVGMYEREQRFPDKDILNKLADYFDVSVDYLLGRTNDKNVYKKITKLDESITTIAAHKLNPHDDLSDDAIAKINEYIEFVRMQQNKK
ncbi:helix-turn-helix domain-containing protein [Terrisporobacter glycolicus]|uniref:HTH cro/C1-type domain-containing protein n=1 Tax=Terrisporobacter glycolicus ATCC 14880 = DSM 1288 TaxID=1121315 RepID=A0ABZ2EXL5_9FIRM|nr:helix-turn-helix transcriptional regulator [Terrisporobacter glycolicus]